MKSVQIDEEVWRVLKQESLDRDCPIKDIIKRLVDNCL